MRIKRANFTVLHPFLFALYPIFALYANNIFQVEFPETVRSIYISLAAVTLLFLFWGRLLKDWHRAGIICSFLVLLYNTLGRFASYFEYHDSIHIPTNVIAAIWAAAAILGTWSMARVMKRFPKEGTRIVNSIGAFALLFCFLGILPKVSPQVFSLLGQRPADRQDSQKAEPHLLPFPEIVEGTPRPDIYYLILDGYGRSDLLKEVYGADNSEFIHFPTFRTSNRHQIAFLDLRAE